MQNLLINFPFSLQLSELPIQNPPLDFEIRYSDEISIKNPLAEDDGYIQNDHPESTSNQNNRNILISDYNPPNSDTFFRNIITKNSNKNILSSVYDGNNHNRVNNNFTATQASSNSNSRPNHKTHVEIITKNGPTKKPNIIVNNYNPHLLHPHPHHNFNLNVRNDLSESFNMRPSSHVSDRKSTCMLYLQADHTFAQKLGSDEASIEAITRHVQRANIIYKNTGEFLAVSLFFHKLVIEGWGLNCHYY